VQLVLQPNRAAARIVLLEVRGGGDAVGPTADIGGIERVDIYRPRLDAEPPFERCGKIRCRLAGIGSARDEVLVALAGDVVLVVPAIAQRSHRDDVVQARSLAHRHIAPGLLGHRDQYFVHGPCGGRVDFAGGD